MPMFDHDTRGSRGVNTTQPAYVCVKFLCLVPRCFPNICLCYSTSWSLRFVLKTDEKYTLGLITYIGFYRELAWNIGLSVWRNSSVA